jgi:glutaredoxin-like protein NrdH
LTDVTVRMYTLSTCSHCKRTKEFFRSQGIEFEFTDVDLLTGDERREIVERIRKLNSRVSYPTILIGDKVIVGFQETEIKDALGLS